MQTGSVKIPRRGPWPHLEPQETFPGKNDAELILEGCITLARPRKVRSAFEVKGV